MNDFIQEETEYVVKVEHIVSYGKTVCDANTSYVERKGPAASRYAYEYFKEKMETEYTNVYGVTNTVHVLTVYRRI